MLIFFLLLTNALAMHPDVAPDHQIHISKCQIAFNEPEQALQMSFHIFIDDLEDALRQRGADELFIGTEKENPQADAHLEAYLREKFILEVNGKPASYVFIGKEPSEDLQAIWCYLEITEVNLFQQLSVSSEVLMDVHEDQKNIIFVERAGKPSELLLLTQQRPSGSLELK